MTARRSGHPEPPKTADESVRTAQMVTLAMMAGLLAGGGVLGFLGLKNGGLGAGAGGASGGVSNDVFAWLVPGLWVFSVVLLFVVPLLLVKQSRVQYENRADDEMGLRRVYGGYVTMQVTLAAVMEGPGLLGAVAAMLTGNGLYLLAPAASALVLALVFPRWSRMERWLEDATGRPRMDI